MSCRLFGAKPLPEQMLTHYELDHYKQTSVKFKSKDKNSLSRKYIWKCRLEDGGHFCFGLSVLKWGIDIIGLITRSQQTWGEVY